MSRICGRAACPDQPRSQLKIAAIAGGLFPLDW
jgi:hypothetical protein